MFCLNSYHIIPARKLTVKKWLAALIMARDIHHILVEKLEQEMVKIW